MKFTGSLVKLKLDINAFKRELEESMKKKVFEAWSAWIDKFVEIVPVWSGASHGTILPLADAIKKTVIIVAPRGSAKHDNSEIGRQKSSAVLTSEPTKVNIEYSTHLFHLFINEYFDARIWGFKLINPGPYNFQGKCGQVATEILAGYQLPNLFEFVKQEEVSLE